MAQSVLKIGSAPAEMVGQGEVGGCHLEGDSACWLWQLAVEKPWSMPGGPESCLKCQKWSPTRQKECFLGPFVQESYYLPQGLVVSHCLTMPLECGLKKSASQLECKSKIARLNMCMFTRQV